VPVVLANPEGGYRATARRQAESFDFLEPALEPGELGRLGSYRILKLLGSGGMGLVFLAEDMHLKRPVALKVMKPEMAGKPVARERFVREARAAATLEHEHIVTIYQVGEENDVPFIAMPLLKGHSLEERLQHGAMPSLDQVLRVGRQIARGLGAAHAAGLVHRDIKPANLWLVPEEGGRIKILDFGLARALAEESHLTQEGALVGTPAYLSPEQARGDRVDHRSDLFSLGVVLYRLSTGQLPFRGESTMAVLLALATQQAQPVQEVNPALPAGLAELIMQLLAKDPALRPASAQEVADRLGALERQQALPPAVAPSSTEVMPALPATPAAETVAQSLVQTERPPSTGGSPVRLRWAVLVPVLAVALALVPLAYFFGPTVLRFATNQGQVVLEVDDPTMEVTIKENGAVIRDPQGQRVITLAAGEHDLEVVIKDADGELRSFSRLLTLARGGKTVLSVRQEYAAAQLERIPPPRPEEETKQSAVVMDAAEVERRIALWVLEKEGTLVVRAGEKAQYVQKAADLPPRFEVVSFTLLRGQQLTDADLAQLAQLTRLDRLQLFNSRITDAGLEQVTRLSNLKFLRLDGGQLTDACLVHLRALTKLEHLELQRTGISDAGLAQLAPLTQLRELTLTSRMTDDSRIGDAGLVHLAAFPNLRMLQLSGPRFTDAGLPHLARLTRLENLALTGTKVTDTGLADLAALRRLQNLNLSNTWVSDAGLVHLAKLKELHHLWLQNTRITDAGLAQLTPLTGLKALNLDGTQVSDAGYEHLAALPGLNQLGLMRSRLSARGCARLKAALPQTRIDWSEPNRTAAGAVLAKGGTVHVRLEKQVEDRLVTNAADLPASYFRLTRVSLVNVKSTPNMLFQLQLGALTHPDFDGLEALDFSGLKNVSSFWSTLVGLTSLKELSLARTQVNDAMVKSLKGFKGLRRLVLDGNPITGDGLADLKTLADLADLSLAQTQVKESALEHLQSLKRLRRLVLDGLPIRGPGLAYLRELPELTELRLGCPMLADIFVSQVGEMKGLQRLSLANSGMSDKGLEPLCGLTGLQELDLTGSKVTEAGVANLQKALPKCRILYRPARQ
jgi:eukaryotic-like serine/threonine-protein kinase